MDLDFKLKQVNLLIMRLERLSADSIWAHRAGGIRGSLLDFLENYDSNIDEKPSEKLESMMAQGYSILENAVKVSFESSRPRVNNDSIPSK